MSTENCVILSDIIMHRPICTSLVTLGKLQWNLFIASVIDCSPTQSFMHNYYCSPHECVQLIFVNHAIQQSMNMVK